MQGLEVVHVILKHDSQGPIDCFASDTADGSLWPLATSIGYDTADPKHRRFAALTLVDSVPTRADRMYRRVPGINSTLPIPTLNHRASGGGYPLATMRLLSALLAALGAGVAYAQVRAAHSRSGDERGG